MLGLFFFHIDWVLKNMCGQNTSQQNYCSVYVVISHFQRLQVLFNPVYEDKEKPKPK